MLRNLNVACKFEFMNFIRSQSFSYSVIQSLMRCWGLELVFWSVLSHMENVCCRVCGRCPAAAGQTQARSRPAECPRGH